MYFWRNWLIDCLYRRSRVVQTRCNIVVAYCQRAQHHAIMRVQFRMSKPHQNMGQKLHFQRPASKCCNSCHRTWTHTASRHRCSYWWFCSRPQEPMCRILLFVVIVFSNSVVHYSLISNLSLIGIDCILIHNCSFTRCILWHFCVRKCANYSHWHFFHLFQFFCIYVSA